MNEIIIHSDGTRTIIGELSHKIAFSDLWKSISENCLPGFFAVIELNEQDGYHDHSSWHLRANQSTYSGAIKYMACDRLLIYHK